MGIRLSDAQQLLPEHGNGEFLAKPLHMCVQENRKFRQSISTGSKAGSATPAAAAPGAAGMERGCREERGCSPCVPHWRGGTERPPAAQGRGGDVGDRGELAHTDALIPANGLMNPRAHTRVNPFPRTHTG